MKCEMPSPEPLFMSPSFLYKLIASTPVPRSNVGNCVLVPEGFSEFSERNRALIKPSLTLGIQRVSGSRFLAYVTTNKFGNRSRLEAIFINTRHI